MGQASGVRVPGISPGRSVTATCLIIGMCGVGTALTQTPDYSAGVKKLFDLGLPDASRARYVKIESRYGMLDPGDMMAGGPKMTGNAWLLETNANGNAVVVIGQLNEVELVPVRIMEQRTKARMEAIEARLKSGQTLGDKNLMDLEPDETDVESMEELGRVQTGDWKEADLNADIRSLTEYLNKAGGDDDYELRRNAARYFLFAAHLLRRGQSAEANQIISLLFKKVGDSRKVLSAVMSQIADVEYNQAYEDFAKSGNWRQYLSSMENLLGRFSTAWRNGPLVQRVAGIVRKRVDEDTAPPVTGDGVTEEDVRIADLLGHSNTVLYLHHPVFSGLSWLASDRGQSVPGELTKKAPGPLDLLQRRGVRAVPLLAAMLKDEWLVRVTGGASASYFSPDLDDDAMSAEDVEQRLEYFSRPLSRGEVARRILEPLVFGPDSTGYRENKPTVDELAQKSRTWHEQHKTDNRSELMRQLLAEGRQEPLHFLMSSPDAADRAAVESFLMNTNKLAENLSYVTQYAQQQGASAKPFVQKYVAELKKQPSLVPRRELTHMDARYVKRREEQARSAIKTLEDLISDKTAEQILQELTASEKKWNVQEMYTANSALGAKLAQEDPDTALTLLLQACLKARDDQLAMFLVQSASALKWAQRRQPASSGADPPKPREFKIEAHADLWKQVLAQKRSAPRQLYWGSEAMSFQAQVASTIEMFYTNPKELRGESGTDSAQFLGARAYEVTVQRAQARLAGTPETELPAYPDKTKVSKERTTRIAQLLRDSTKENQHEIAGRLTLDELVAVPDLVSADPKLNEKLVPGSHLIQNVRMTLTNDALAQFCQSLKGKALDRKSLESLIAECKRLAGQGSNLMVTVERRLPLAGVSLNVGPGDHQAGMPGFSFGRTGAGDQALVIAMLRAEGADGLDAHAQWPTQMVVAPSPGATNAGPAKVADDDLLPGQLAGMGDYFKRQEEEFWSEVDKLFEPARDACQPYTCTLSVQRSNPMEEE